MFRSMPKRAVLSWLLGRLVPPSPPRRHFSKQRKYNARRWTTAARSHAAARPRSWGMTGRAGDAVYTLTGEWHWHGAAPGHFMTRLSITEGVGAGERPQTEWGAQVTDEEYGGR